MNSEYLVLLPIEAMPRGTPYPQGQSLPLRCTLMHWFHLGSALTPGHLYNELMLLASSGAKDHIELVSEKPELFGPNADVPVHVLQRNEELNLLHTQLLKFLAGVDSLPVELRWIGAGYRPHVATCEGRAFLPGTRHRARFLTLIERGEDKNKVVRSSYQFRGIPF